MLKTLIITSALIGSTVTMAGAQPLNAIQSSTIDLGSTHGSAYYVAETDGYHLIATLDTGNNVPVRFVTTLANGQSATVSVPGALGEAAVEITFVRDHDKVEVRHSANSSDATTASLH